VKILTMKEVDPEPSHDSKKKPQADGHHALLLKRCPERYLTEPRMTYSHEQAAPDPMCQVSRQLTRKSARRLAGKPSAIKRHTGCFHLSAVICWSVCMAL